MRVRKLTILLTLFVGFAAWGRDDSVPGSRYTSARGAAMGDAFLPLADDGMSSLFYNPAGLGHLKGVGFEGMNLELGANKDYVNHFNRNAYKVINLKEYAPTVSGYQPAAPGAFGAYAPSFYMRGFAFGILVDSSLWSRASGGNIEYKSRYQVIPAIGTGVKLAHGIIRIGYSLQWVHTSFGTVTAPINDPNLGYNEKLEKGAALSHNLGLAFTLPFAYLPSFNVVARNVAGAHYSSSFLSFFLGSGGGGVPAADPMTFDTSFSVQPKLGKGGVLNWVLEYRDATNQSRTSALMRAATGVEISLGKSFFVRGGYGTGYPAAGIGFRRKKAEFALSWFTEERGKTFRSEPDTRYMLQYQLRAF